MNPEKKFKNELKTAYGRWMAAREESRRRAGLTPVVGVIAIQVHDGQDTEGLEARCLNIEGRPTGHIRGQIRNGCIRLLFGDAVIDEVPLKDAADGAVFEYAYLAVVARVVVIKKTGNNDEELQGTEP